MMKNALKDLFVGALLTVLLSACGESANEPNDVSCVLTEFDNGTVTSECDDGTITSYPLNTPKGMVFIPGGDFLMGCNQDPDDSSLYPCDESERPAHNVSLSPYFIGRFEVTHAEFNDCVKAGFCDDGWNRLENLIVDGSGNNPISLLNWEDSENYCEWLGYRLPTEAEWEFAARGTDGRLYPWGNESADCEYAHLEDPTLTLPSGCGDEITVSVGSYPLDKSPFGVMDMAGNLAEVVSDWWSADYFETSPVFNPQGPLEGTFRVAKGGAWYTRDGRSSIRRSVPRDPTYPRVAEHDEWYGFRCAY